MGSLTGGNHQTMTSKQAQVSVMMVTFPAQGHLNQMLQLSCLISSHGLLVHYVASALHNRQGKVRINALNPLLLSKLHFHDLPILPYASPPPNPKSSHKFPTQLQPAWDPTLNLPQPLADYMRDMASKYKRVIVILDFVIAVLVQDVVSIPNAESYAFNSISAFCLARLVFEQVGKPFPMKLSKDLPLISDCISKGLQGFLALQTERLSYRAGDIYNTCRILEPPFLDILESEEVSGNRKSWAMGPFLPEDLKNWGFMTPTGS